MGRRAAKAPVMRAGRLTSLACLVLACAACPSGGQQAAPGASGAGNEQREEIFSRVLKAASNPACPASFPHGYRFVGTTPSEAKALFGIVWLDGVSRGDYVVAISPDAKDAAAARCIAIGPHLDLNIVNWCCR